MHHLRQLAHAALLMSGIALAVVGCATKAVAEQSAPAPGEGRSATVVLRGSISDDGASFVNDAPVVLRGSPARSEPSPTAGYACPPGYAYDPGSGCVTPDYGYISDNYGYGYWPYWGFDGFYSDGRRHRIRANKLTRIPPVRSGN